MKTLINYPELKIQVSQDGVWLHFKTQKGLSAALNLNRSDSHLIVDRALTQWACDYAEQMDQNIPSTP